MNFTIVRQYSIDDPDFDGDAVNVRLIDDKGAVLISGDWYHDQVDDQIRGFMKAVAFFGKRVKVETRRETSEEY